MKKLIIAVVFAAVMFTGLPIFAQSGGRHQSEYYYVNLSLEKIYPYHQGYIVQYRKGINELGRLYLPMKWFVGADNKGEIVILPKGTVWPSLSVYFKNGEFSHCRLYIHHMASHQTWGTVPQNVNLEDRFNSVEKIELNFK